MSTDEELLNCVRHARGIIQTYCLFNLLIKFFLKLGLNFSFGSFLSTLPPYRVAL